MKADRKNPGPIEAIAHLSEVLYQSLLEQIPAVIYIATLEEAEGDLYVSPQIERLLGFPKEKWLHDPGFWMSRMHPEDRERVVAAFRMTRTTAMKFSEEYRLIARDGEVVWFHDEARIIRDQHQQPLYLQGVMFDIRPTKWMETALRESRQDVQREADQRVAEIKAAAGVLEKTEQRLRFALQAGELGLWDLSIETGELYRNEHCVTMLGYSNDEIGNNQRDWDKLVHPEDLPGAQQVWKDYLDGRSPFYDTEYRLLTKSGDWKWILARGKIVERNTNGEPLRAVGILQDIGARKEAQLALQRSEDRLRTITDSVPALIAYIDREQRLRFANKVYRDWFGLEPEEIYAHSVREIQGEQAYTQIRGHIEQALSGETVSFEQDLRATDLPRCVQTTYIPHFDDKRKVLGCYVLAYDVTARKLAEEALRASEERFRLIAENVSDLIAVVDTRGRRLYNSPSYRALFGDDTLSPGNSSFEQIHPDDREAVMQMFKDTVATGIGRRAQFRFQLKDGGVRFIESQGSVIRNAVGEVDKVVIVSRDVTERLSAEERLRYLAHHDLLTELPNRALLQDRVDQALLHAKRTQDKVAVLFIDLDNFKNINDSLGHAVGDQLLKEAARRLKGCLRAEDTVARQGGDEFIVLLPHVVEPADAIEVTQKILQALSELFVIDTHDLEVTASVGISVFPDDGTSAEVLLKNADTAMYHAKALGKNGYQTFTGDMDEAVRQRLELERGLRIARERKEFVLFYQPRVDLIDGRLTGVEALIRWRHPKLGLLGPLQFVQFAEENGMIIPIGEWVLREACRQIKAWRDAGLSHFRVAVNVSGRQFRQYDFLDRVASILRDSGVDPSSLELELTESVIMQHAQQTITTLDRLRNMGVEIAIDDFGTGYSSLSYLKRFGVDRLKIDRSFVRDIATDRNDAAIVSAIIAMARNLDISVVAEGVETEQQLTFLREQGCTEGQGFYFGKPLPAAEFEAFLGTSQDFH